MAVRGVENKQGRPARPRPGVNSRKAASQPQPPPSEDNIPPSDAAGGGSGSGGDGGNGGGGEKRKAPDDDEDEDDEDEEEQDEEEEEKDIEDVAFSLGLVIAATAGSFVEGLVTPSANPYDIVESLSAGIRHVALMDPWAK